MEADVRGHIRVRLSSLLNTVYSWSMRWRYTWTIWRGGWKSLRILFSRWTVTRSLTKKSIMRLRKNWNLCNRRSRRIKKKMDVCGSALRQWRDVTRIFLRKLTVIKSNLFRKRKRASNTTSHNILQTTIVTNTIRKASTINSWWVAPQQVDSWRTRTYTRLYLLTKSREIPQWTLNSSNRSYSMVSSLETVQTLIRAWPWTFNINRTRKLTATLCCNMEQFRI